MGIYKILLAITKHIFENLKAIIFYSIYKCIYKLHILYINFIYVYMYMYTYVHYLCIYICIHIYIDDVVGSLDLEIDAD